jgi:hypothetical protein
LIASGVIVGRSLRQEEERSLWDVPGRRMKIPNDVYGNLITLL